MSDKLKTLNDLLHEQLRDLYSAENQLLDVMPDMVSAAKDSRLKQAFETHLKQTRKPGEPASKRLGRGMNLDLKGHKCKGHGRHSERGQGHDS